MIVADFRPIRKAFLYLFDAESKKEYREKLNILYNEHHPLPQKKEYTYEEVERLMLSETED